MRCVPKIGRRGAMLLLMGIVYLVVGVGLLTYRVKIPGSFLETWPMWLRVGIWWASAVIALVSAFKHRDAMGWLALYIPPVIRLVAYAGALVFYLVPGGQAGSPMALLAGINSGVLVGAVMICSGWEEPSRPREGHHDHD